MNVNQIKKKQGARLCMLARAAIRIPVRTVVRCFDRLCTHLRAAQHVPCFLCLRTYRVRGAYGAAAPVALRALSLGYLPDVRHVADSRDGGHR